MRSALAAALLLSACWTGADPPAIEPATPAKRPAPEPLNLRIRLERTACFGTCPAYTVSVQGDGRVEWIGHSSVATLGRQQGHVTRGQLEELSRRLDRVRFFERDEYGELPKKPECTTVGSTTQCSFGTSVTICSDTSHTIISAWRGSRTHRIDNDHCNDRPELDALEDYIDRITNTEAWIGR
ncbi:MAG TPA: DUF6438 domain-containing protein [Kofleriaceae bacterium]